MCGIAGIVDRGGADGAELGRTLGAMSRAVAHRGPDAEGAWTDPEAGIALAHRRLAIQDLSAAGAQPMHSACGRYVLSYNGEVFTGPEIRAELEARGHRFHGHSDTEAILEGVAAWGVAATLPRMVGQFALALWDREERSLTLVRDRLGIKPLYWARAGRRVAFASELQGLVPALPEIPPICREGLGAYLAQGVIPAPLTIYQGVRKLEPGQVLTLPAEGEPRIRPFWSLADMLARVGRAPRVSDPAEARALIEAQLSEAVRCRLLSDVPLGAFLSGGIDSTLITALMQEASAGPVRSFSVGMSDRAYDEAGHAREIARHLGTRHTELTLDPATCLAAVPTLAQIYGEPFGDQSALPTLLLSRLAREHVTVALSGDGGDEVFAGYTRHRWHQRISAGGASARLIGLAARAAGALPAHLVDGAARLRGRTGLSRRAAKLAALARAEADSAAAHRAMTGAEAPWAEALASFAPHERMQALDLLSYLPDDILTKVDRASMNPALEVRVPFLDHRVIEAGFRLSPEMKLKGGETKHILRRMLADRVPPSLTERPKQGFEIPVAEWLRGPLSGWAEGLLAGTDWQGDLGLDPAPIRAHWAQHKTGRTDTAELCWPYLMLASWAEARSAGR